MMKPLLATVLILLPWQAFAWPGTTALSGPTTVELGDIPSRTPPPKWPFRRFFELQPLNALTFSPDNRQLFFIRNDGDIDNVFAIGLNTFTMRQITHYREPVLQLMVSRNGRDLFIVQDTGGDERYNIYRYNLASGETQQITDSPADDMSWLCDQSPDGNTLYFGQSRDQRNRSDLWRLDIDSGEVSLVLASQGRLLECGPISPDGRYLVFYQYIENNERHVGLVDLQRNLHWYVFRKPHVNNINAAFSEDSLYFLNAWRTDDFYLWHYRLKTGYLAPEPSPIPHPLQAFTLWDAGRIAVFYYRAWLTTHTAIFLHNRRQPEQWHLPPGEIIDVVFSETDPSLALFIMGDASTPERYYLSTPAGLTLLYDSNTSGIAADQFAEARSLVIPSFDGLPVPTHLFIPNGTSAKSRRPLLLWIHGGPETYIDPEFSSYFQFLANQGYIVATPNVRGSTGFGKWYASLDDGDWGGAHIRDIIAVTEYLKQLPFVDADHVFIFGESFGGYSVLSAITQFPDQFTAAVEFSGINELASFLDSLADYAERYLILQMGFDPRKDHYQNWLRSPYYHAENIRIPLQIHQGKNDFRVTKRLTDRLVNKLKALGREVEYYVYDDEGHGLLKFHNEEKAYNRMVRFLDRLSGPARISHQFTTTARPALSSSHATP